MSSETNLQRLASVVLGEPVVPWIRERRREGSCSACGSPKKKTWRRISDELRTATNGAVDVGVQTLINWAPDDEPAVAAS